MMFSSAHRTGDRQWLTTLPGIARMLASALALGLGLGLGHARASEVTPWELRQEDVTSGTRVWLRPRDGWVPEFRATTQLQVRLSSLVAVLLDSAHTHEWVYRTRQALPLESAGPSQGVSLVITVMPWPLADRESVVAWQLTQDPQTLAVELSGHAAPEKAPPHPDRVRMPSFASRWQLTPRPGGMVDVAFEGHGDPGGNLGLPLLREFVRQAVWQGPWFTINALREIVKRPEYSQAELPFIREPAP